MPSYSANPIKSIELRSPPKVTSSTGTVWWQEDFESNVLKFTNGTLDNTAQCVRSGAYSLKVTSAGSSPWLTQAVCYAQASTPQILIKKCGMEVCFKPEAVTTAAGGLTSIDFAFTFKKDGNAHAVAIRCLFGAAAGDAKLQYWNSAGSFADIAGATFTANANAPFYRLKFTWDPINATYGKVFFNESIYDLSSTAYQTSVNAEKMTDIRLKVDGVDATTKSCWFDDLVLTTDEPE